MSEELKKLEKVYDNICANIRYYEKRGEGNRVRAMKENLDLITKKIKEITNNL